eukprot:1488783-Rhodomonas_salina.4
MPNAFHTLADTDLGRGSSALVDDAADTTGRWIAHAQSWSWVCLDLGWRSGALVDDAVDRAHPNVRARQHRVAVLRVQLLSPTPLNRIHRDSER